MRKDDVVASPVILRNTEEELFPDHIPPPLYPGETRLGERAESPQSSCDPHGETSPYLFVHMPLYGNAVSQGVFHLGMPDRLPADFRGETHLVVFRSEEIRLDGIAFPDSEVSVRVEEFLPFDAPLPFPTQIEKDVLRGDAADPRRDLLTRLQPDRLGEGPLQQLREAFLPLPFPPPLIVPVHRIPFPRTVPPIAYPTGLFAGL